MRQQLLSILKSDIAKSSTMIFAAILSSNFILFLANLYISKSLGPENFGVLKTILYFFTFIPSLIDLGINVTLTKYIAEFSNRSKEKIGYMVKKLFEIKIFSYAGLAILFLAFRDQVTTLFLKDASLSYLIVPGILLTVFTFFSTFEAIMLGYQKFKYFALSQFLGMTISSVLGVLMLPFGVYYVILGWSFGPLIGNIFNLRFFIEKRIIKVQKEFDVKRIFYGFSLPMLLTNIPTGLISAIVPLLSLFFYPTAVGYFSFAFIFYSATTLVPNSLSVVLFPKISELNGLKKHQSAKDILKKAFVLYTLVALIGMIIVLFFSEQIVTTISEDYLPSLAMFRVLIILGLLFGYNMIYTNYLKGLGKVKKFALLNLIQNLLLILVSFILISNA